MAHDEEQQQAEGGFLIDHTLVSEVINQTRGVNANLGSLLAHTMTCIRRQNMLLVLLIILISLQGLQLVLGFSMQHLQQSAKAQLAAVDYGRKELLSAVQEAKREVSSARAELETVRMDLQSAPTVTADSKGRISLEVPIDSPSKPDVGESARLPPDRLVIPLQPKQSRREK